MLINKSNLTAVFINLKTTFNKAFADAPIVWPKTGMMIPSTSSQNDYAWIDRFPKMRKWLGDKTIRALKAHQYTIINDDYEATVEVDRNDIDDDNLGLYGVMAQDAGFSAKQWPEELMNDLKNGAFAAVCYDGQYFYDTDHEVAGASVSNKGTKALSAATTAAALASYGAARTAILGFTDDEGRPLHSNTMISCVLEVPPALESVGHIICKSDKLTDESPNPYMGTAELVVNPGLSSATAWFLHVVSRPIKPFIFQQRKAPVFVSQTNTDSDDVFMRKKFKYGAEARGSAGYGLWQLSYGSTGTT